MKTLLFLNHNHENVGTYFRCLAIGKYLSQKGFKIKMICASGKKIDLLIRKKNINDNFQIITLPRIKYHQYFTGQFWRLILTCLMIFIIKYDICYAFAVAQPQIAIPAWLSKKIKRKKLIVDWDDLWSDGFGLEHNNLINKIFGYFENKFIKYADKITYVSEFLGNKITQKGLGEKATKIINGTDLQRLPVLDKADSRRKLNLPKEEIILVSIGNTYLGSMKIILEALKKVIEQNQNIKNKIKLYFVGNVVINEKYKELFNELKNNVIMTGLKPMIEMPLYMASSDVLLLPMEESAVEKARFPMRLGEYLSAQRLIVSNAVGEVKYYLEKYQAGLTSEPESIENFANNIIKTINNQAQFDEYRIRARSLAENQMQWDQIIEKLINNVICIC